MQGQGLQPDVITYSATISACAKGHQPERALELLAEMQGRGLDPNVITYSAAIYQRSYQRMREGTTT